MRDKLFRNWLSDGIRRNKGNIEILIEPDSLIHGIRKFRIVIACIISPFSRNKVEELSPLEGNKGAGNLPTACYLLCSQPAALHCVFHRFMESQRMIRSRILTAREYNAILDFDENEEQILARVHLDTLIGLGKIFVKHGVTSNFGVHLLHRHFPIPDGSVMLYDNRDPDMEICWVTPLDRTIHAELRGRTFKVNDSGQFVPYEYDIGDDFQVSNEFLAELSDEIQKNGQQDVLALEYDPTPHDRRQRSEYIIKDKALVKVRTNGSCSPSPT
jgi:hypothetical protein